MPGEGLIHRLELLQSILKLALRIIALANPVMRIGGVTSLRVLLQKALELGNAVGCTAAVQGAQRLLIGGLFTLGGTGSGGPPSAARERPRLPEPQARRARRASRQY